MSLTGGPSSPRRVAVSVTIDPELVAWLDNRVAAKEFRSRSHAVESLLEFARKGGMS